MKQIDQASLAERFRCLNLSGRLLLPNAWDAASARIFEQEGFPALGTTSAGIAYSRGFRDGEQISRSAMLKEIAVIASAVKIPVSADIEAGYGSSPEDVAVTVDAAIDAGTVGVNIEDGIRVGAAPLFDVGQQALRISAARAVAQQRGIPVVINARIDTFLIGGGQHPSKRLAATIERASAYHAAGADIVFVPLLVDLGAIRDLASAVSCPISVMALPNGPSADTLFEAGASRVSVGQTAMLAVLGSLREIAGEIRTRGTWSALNRLFYGFAEAESLFAERN